MVIYNLFNKVISSSLALLGLSLVIATIDHFYFDEAYRETIRVIGIFALVMFFVGILTTVIKGALDKNNSDGR